VGTRERVVRYKNGSDQRVDRVGRFLKRCNGGGGILIIELERKGWDLEWKEREKRRGGVRSDEKRKFVGCKLRMLVLLSRWIQIRSYHSKVLELFKPQGSLSVGERESDS